MTNQRLTLSLPSHIFALDGLRGCAIGLVLCHNTSILTVGPDLLGRLFSRVSSLGWVGVQLFFVLSGFLISRNLLLSQSSNGYFRAFYARRILRIFPLYYATLIFFFVLLPCIGYLPQAVKDDQPHQIWLWLFLSNWTEWMGLGGLSLPHFWSLAVEEQFYLLWPFIVFRRTPKQLLLICALIAAVSLGIRCAMVLNGVAPLLIYTSSLCRMDALAFGAMVAAAFTIPGFTEAILRFRTYLLLFVFGLIAVGKLIPNGFGMTDPLGQTVGYTLLAVMFAVVIVLVIAGDSEPSSHVGNLLRTKALRVLGKHSFAMYLFHVPLHTYVGLGLLEQLGWLEHPSTFQSFTYTTLVFVCSLAMAFLAYHLFEKRVLRLKRFFVP